MKKTYFKRNNKELFIKETKSKARLIYEHKCLNCERDFISNRKTAIYCCNTCKVTYFRKRLNALAKVERRRKALEHVEKILREQHEKSLVNCKIKRRV